MDCTVADISYNDTGFYSKLVLDYLSQDEKLKPFYNAFPAKDAIQQAIGQQQKYATDRKLLVTVLEEQYSNSTISEKVAANIQLLQQPTTFTIVTAHQPNIFTGPLYFIYKILHAIKIAEDCKAWFPNYDFVPVYYMGSEDADLDELGQISINGEAIVWDTKQTGAVGRMQIDKSFLKLIQSIEGEMGVLPFGNAIVLKIKEFYKEGASVQDATQQFVNYLFGDYGLIVLIPDAAALKSVAIKVFKDELLNRRSSGMVEETAKELDEAGYKVQAHGRDINLFYLTDAGRNRIEYDSDKWSVVDAHIVFTETELLRELETHPERFSPNVILRPLFQEMVLPNLVFVGGGGELAYWIQLKKIFDYYQVPYPLLVLRNSFLFVNEKQKALAQKQGLGLIDLFKPLHDIKNEWISKHSTQNLEVGDALASIKKSYDQLKGQALPIDNTLVTHIETLEQATVKRIEVLQKKMLRAEKRNHANAMNQLDKLKSTLFPNNSLQERVENFIPFYAQYGKAFIEMLYNYSLSLEQQFRILEES